MPYTNVSPDHMCDHSPFSYNVTKEGIESVHQGNKALTERMN